MGPLSLIYAFFSSPKDDARTGYQEQPPLDKLLEDGAVFYNHASAALAGWYHNFTTNTHAGFANMSAKNWIRLITIVCTVRYALIRPYLLKLGARVQRSHLEKEEKRMEAERAAMDANDLRSAAKVAIPGVDSSDEEEVVKESEWGRKARVRQRKIVRKAIERHEEMLHHKGMESDEDIRDLLED